jgi:hypothetical protein
VHIKRRTDLFSLLKEKFPAHRWVHAFASVFGGIGKGRRVKCELVVVGKSRSWKKKIAHKEKN